MSESETCSLPRTPARCPEDMKYGSAFFIGDDQEISKALHVNKFTTILKKKSKCEVFVSCPAQLLRSSIGDPLARFGYLCQRRRGYPFN